MDHYLAAVAFFLTQEAAENAADQLRHQDFSLRSVQTKPGHSKNEASSVSWCASPSGERTTLAGDVLEQICMRILLGSAEPELKATALSYENRHGQPALLVSTEHMVVAYGTPEKVQTAVETFAKAGALDVDLF